MLTKVALDNPTLSAKGANTGIAKIANPEDDCIKMPKKIKIINKIIAKAISGKPSTAFHRLFNIESEILPSFSVKFIPLAIPITKETPTKSPAPRKKHSIASFSVFL